MKDRDMCGTTFWGILLVLLGISVIVNAVFGIHLPVFKIIIAGFLIYMGISILVPSRTNKNCTFFFKSYDFEESPVKEKYKVCFGSSTINLEHLKNLTTEKNITVYAQFANVVIILPSQVPVRVKADISFATVHMPGHTMNSEYVNLYDASEPLLTVYIKGAFSTIVVKE